MRIGTILLVVFSSVVLTSVAMTEGTTGAEPVRFAIIGDRVGGHTPGVYEAVLTEIEQLRPEFIMTVGDHIEGYTEDSSTLNTEWTEYLNLVKDVKVPIHFTPGNHDITTPGMEPFFRRYIGEPYYSFDYRGMHIVVFDNTPGGGSIKVSPLPEAQYSWLERDLNEHRNAAHTLVFCHKPFWYNTLAVGKSDPMHDLFRATGVDAVFSGHFHQYMAAEYDGIKYVSVGSSGGAIDSDAPGFRYHFAWVTVDDGGVWVAPIDKGAVRTWDFQSPDDLHLIQRIMVQGIEQTSPLVTSPDLSVANATIALTLHNFSKTIALDDTLRWDSLAGWEMKPRETHVVVPPGGQTEADFTVSCKKDLFPRPNVSVNCPVKEGLTWKISQPVWVARQAHCPAVTTPPKVDGKLSPGEWTGSESKLFSEDGSPSRSDRADFYFCHDGKYLYLAARCAESVPDSVIASVRERDGSIFGEDCIGYFLAPDPVGDTVYQIYISPLGTIYDQIIIWDDEGSYDTDKSWNCPMNVKALVDNKGWTVEARIPAPGLNRTAFDSDWGLNFRRKQKRLNTSADWQVPIDYTPRTYGRLVFGR